MRFLMLATGIVPLAYLHSGVRLPLVVTLIVALDHQCSSWLAAWAIVALGHASYATYILQVPDSLLFVRFEPSIWDSGELVVAYAAVLALAARTLGSRSCVGVS